MSHPIISRPLQSRFLDIPQTPLAYWLRERFSELLAGKTLGDVADVRQGLAAGNDIRYVRFVWDVRPSTWSEPIPECRWVRESKLTQPGWWPAEKEEGGRIKDESLASRSSIQAENKT